ncbi:polysaccharide chain length determinant protein (PEP-CTERM system associated) [Luteibacter rhizovicinus]|uniref:Polysaccharide chain length determinant protein (PEP-CTERM system associated) n=1 Tax=Luteibacter rhizovicinus TaxID=242606 RepID=A0A4R3YYC1_9GAMM|nr:XrtA system polysaccharide chain length determinant [Luteibacter rhizovicinus]TCV97596.1 polysaccharide chain length determinant protein (PEP-CTERM system associated) [Luteibacter rhizovicinus]
MSGELTPFGGMLPALVSEARRRRVTMAFVFAAIALAALAIGMLWPKKYEASTSILAQEASIITPLMEGAASTTANKNRAGIARDVIFSRKVMSEILASGGWMATNPSPVEQDKLIEGIKSRTNIQTSRDNLITITYFDSDPRRAFAVTKQFAQLFITESLASKQRESRDAYEFINNQVEMYRKKLTDAEDKLKEYRDANADARPGSEADTLARISQLRNQIENTRMNLMEKRSQEGALAGQLSGESEVNAIQTNEGVFQSQMADLQNQLDRLLLTYTDEYPDVIRVRHQMADLQQQLQQQNVARQNAAASGTPIPIDNGVRMNPLYQQLKLQMAATRGDIAATSARVGASEAMLQAELERSKRIANSENVTSELTRDYNVNRDVYQDLLKRRENARVSMNLDAEQRGLTFLVQNPAVMPLVPSGLRFMHFGLAGVGLSLAVPFGLLFALVRLDPRVRSIWQLERNTGLSVLADIPFYPTPRDRRRERLHNMLLVLIIAGVAAVYLILFWLRLKG